MFNSLIMKIIVCSFQYAPVHKQHCIALGEQSKIYFGCEIKYIFSKKFEWMIEKDIKPDCYFIGGSENIFTLIMNYFDIRNYINIIRTIHKEKPDFIYIWSMNPIFNFITGLICKNNHIKLIQHVHEPYFKNKKIYGSTMRIWSRLLEEFQHVYFQLCDEIILSSEESYNLFSERYEKHLKKVIKIPLLFKDAGPGNEVEKKYDAIYFGPPSTVKGKEIFLKILDHSSNEKRSLKFVMLCRTGLLDDRFLKYSNLTIITKNDLSDDEVGMLIKQSKVALIPYLSARQSSAAVTSFMYSTPVVGSKIEGLKEIIDDTNGVLLDLNSSPESWVRQIIKVIEMYPTLSDGARKTFEEKYTENLWKKYLSSIFT